MAYVAYSLAATSEIPLKAFIFAMIALVYLTASILIDFLFGWSASAESFAYLLNSVLILEETFVQSK